MKIAIRQAGGPGRGDFSVLEVQDVLILDHPDNGGDGVVVIESRRRANILFLRSAEAMKATH